MGKGAANGRYGVVAACLWRPRLRALSLTSAVMLMLCLLTTAAFAQGAGGGGGGGNNSNPVDVACNGQPRSLKLCRPGNQACLTPALAPLITAASPGGVVATTSNQITFTGIPASGASISYRISVRNIGQVNGLNQIPSNGTIDSASNAFILSPGDSTTISFPNVAGPGSRTQSIDIVRPANGGYSMIGYSVTCTPRATTGKLTIIKNSTGGPGTFTIELKGPGGTRSVGITTAGGLNGTGSNVLTLDPGNYTLTETPPTGWRLQSISCVNASGTGSASGPSVNLDAGDDTVCTVTNAKQIAGLSFTKTAVTQSFKAAGEPIEFKLRAVNSGTGTFTNIAVSDPGTVLSGCTAAALASGGVLECTATRTATQADLKTGRYDNTAVLTATRPDATVATAAAKATVFARISGGLSVSQEASPQTYSDTGQTISFALSVRNTSGVEADDVSLTLSQARLLSCAPYKLPGSLPPGATTSCRAQYMTTIADMNGKCLSNTARVAGTRAGSTVIDSATAKVCMTPDKTASAIRHFIARRTDLLAANEPDSLRAIRRFRAGIQTSSNPVEVTGGDEGGNGNIAFKTSLSQMLVARRSSEGDEGRMALGANAGAGKEASGTAAKLPYDIWVEATYLRWRDKQDELGRSGDLGLAYIGADITIAPGLIVGAVVQTDFMTDHTDASNVDLNGNGWLAGPFVTMKLSDNLYFDGRAAYGQSDNTIKPFGTYADHFETERWLARANLAGSWNFGPWRLTPSAGVAYVEETQHAFTNALGEDIAAQRVSLGQLTFGPELAYAFQLGDGSIIQPHISLTGMWDFASSGMHGENAETSTGSGLGGRIEAGVLYQGAEGASIRAALNYDGIGSRAFESWGGQLSVNVPLEAITDLAFAEHDKRSALGAISYAGATDGAAEPAASGDAAEEADASGDGAPAEYELPSVVVEEMPDTTPAAKPRKALKAKPAGSRKSASPKKAANSKAKANSGQPAAEASSNAAAFGSGGAEATAAPGEGGEDGAESGSDSATASRPRRIVEQIAAIEEITAKDIEQRGARSLDEALELASGLHIRNAADGVPRIDIRGLRTRNITLLVDGVPVNSTFDGQFDPRAIPVENIARIKVVKGGSSVLYGPGGNAAVIDIITKGAAKGLHGSAQAQYSPERGTDERITASYGSDTIRLFMSASALDQDSYPLSSDFTPTRIQGPGDRLNSDRRDQALYGNLMWTPSSVASFGMSVNWRTGEYGKPVGTVSRAESIFAQRERYERVDNFDTLSLSSSGMIRFSPGFYFRPLAYYNRSNELTNNYDDTRFSTQVRANALREDAITEIGGGGAQAILKQGESQLTIAIDGHNESWESSGFQVPCLNTAADGSCSVDGTAASFDFDHDVQVFSVSAEQELKFSDQLSGVLGAGYSQQRKLAISDDGYTYLAGMRYELTDTTAVRGSIARKIRFPTLRDLYDVQGGNPNLETEVTDNYDAAIEQQFPQQNLGISVGVFRIDAENFIQRVDGLSSNVAVLKFQGIETSATWRGVPGLELTTGHTYLDAKNLTPGAGTSELQYRPEHKLTLTARYAFDTGTTLNADYLFVAGSKALPGGDGGGGGGAGDGPTPVLPLDSYHVVNAGITQSIPQTGAELFGRIDNVFDENYVESFSHPQPGRSYFFGMRAKF